MKRTLLATAIAMAIASVGTNAQMPQMPQMPGFGGSTFGFQQFQMEYQYVRQEMMMSSLSSYVTMAAPSYACGAGGCNPTIATDPASGATMAHYPSGNTLFMQQNQVYYSFESVKYHFSSTDYTMGSFCGCTPSMPSQSSFINMRQMGYTYEYVRQEFQQSSYINTMTGFRSAARDRHAEQPVSMPVDEATDALLEQALAVFNDA
ncbi:MAG: hypothetical protein GY862_34865 [Gammaproteobacteria bacterium]|nr:hypothetical protein [Gammaproteobacteria bacterium]